MGDLLIHYGWGLFVTLNPCVLPILPFVILSALNVNRWGPISLSAGLLTAYAVVGGTLAVIFAEAVGEVSEGLVSHISALLLITMGVLFLVPRFYAAFTGFLGRFSAGAQQKASDIQGSSLKEQFLIGFLLALAWVPCSTPALIAAGSSSSGADVSVIWVYLRYAFFGLGAVTFILVLGLGARGALMARRNAIAGWVDRLKPFMGALLILMGLLILTGGITWIETQLSGWSSATEGFGEFLEQSQEETLGTNDAALPSISF